MKAWRRARLLRKGPVYVAMGPTGSEGWPFRRKRFASAQARLRSWRPSQEWTVTRYGPHW